MKVMSFIIITAVILAVLFVSACTQYEGQQQPQPSAVPAETPAPATPITPTVPAAPPAAQPAPTVEGKTVEISAAGFSPSTVEVNVGDTVTWINKDAVAHRPASAVHPTHTVYPETGGCIGSKFDACKNLTQGESFTFTFNHAGEWKYHDHLNCCTDSRFFGTVIVKAPGAVEPLPKQEAAKPSASVILESAPKIAAAGVGFSVSWKITSEPGTTSHTAVHYGKQSVPSPNSPADYSFTSHVFCTSTPCKVPNSFQTPITIQEDGIYYYRAHTILGGNHFWSDEIAVNVSSSPEVVRAVTMPSGGGGGY